jgi:excinuclease UvrABC nuclease subunit
MTMKNKIESKTRISVVEEADQLLLAEKFADAEDLYRKLVDGLTELLGGQHPEVAKALHKLAAAQAAQEKFNEAKTNEDQSQLLETVLKPM